MRHPAVRRRARARASVRLRTFGTRQRFLVGAGCGAGWGAGTAAGGGVGAGGGGGGGGGGGVVENTAGKGNDGWPTSGARSPKTVIPSDQIAPVRIPSVAGAATPSSSSVALKPPPPYGASQGPKVKSAPFQVPSPGG